jgi:hypothetical protein
MRAWTAGRGAARVPPTSGALHAGHDAGENPQGHAGAREAEIEPGGAQIGALGAREVEREGHKAAEREIARPAEVE